MKPTGEPACLIRIVDDEPRALEAVAFMLECEGYETACFSSAQEFLTSEHSRMRAFRHPHAGHDGTRPFR